MSCAPCFILKVSVSGVSVACLPCSHFPWLFPPVFSCVCVYNVSVSLRLVPGHYVPCTSHPASRLVSKSLLTSGYFITLYPCFVSCFCAFPLKSDFFACLPFCLIAAWFCVCIILSFAPIRWCFVVTLFNKDSYPERSLTESCILAQSVYWPWHSWRLKYKNVHHTAEESVLSCFRMCGCCHRLCRSPVQPYTGCNPKPWFSFPLPNLTVFWVNIGFFLLSSV